MARAIDIISIALLTFGLLTFALGVYDLTDGRDLRAVYWLLIGAALLRAATDLLRPKSKS